jgi:hypothetical protein
VERIGQCHCGSLRVIATGEPDRVYLCHCKACQRRTGTAFLFGASFPKEQVRLDGERKVYERDADSGYRIRFHFCPNCGTTLYWEGDRNSAVCGVAVGALTPLPSRRPAIQFGKSRFIDGSGCRRLWNVTGTVDHQSRKLEADERRATRPSQREQTSSTAARPPNLTTTSSLGALQDGLLSPDAIHHRLSWLSARRSRQARLRALLPHRRGRLRSDR